MKLEIDIDLDSIPFADENPVAGITFTLEQIIKNIQHFSTDYLIGDIINLSVTDYNSNIIGYVSITGY